MEAPKAALVEGVMHQSPIPTPVLAPAPAGSRLDQGKSISTPDGIGEQGMTSSQSRPSLPWGLNWRCSAWYITTVVTIGVTSDILTYSIVIPVLPYRLEALNYTNISSLTSWLLFAYSAGIFVFTFPVAWYFHKHKWRREPLVAAVLGLIGALILFMLAKPYWVMVLARVIQGACSTVVWSVGFALLCENVDPKNVGRQLGFAFSGISIGLTIAPPIGGALYFRLGWHAPFIFCIGLCAADLITRLLVLERRDIARWEAKHGPIQPQSANSKTSTTTLSASVSSADNVVQMGEGMKTKEVSPPTVQRPHEMTADVDGTIDANTTEVKGNEVERELSPIGVLVTLARVPRGTVAFMLVFVFGFIMGAIDPTFTLHVEDTWNKDSDFVGLLYLAAAAPTFFVGPLSGAMADRYGAELIVVPSLILSLPWLPLMIINNLPLFAVMFAFANIFISVLNAAASLEMAQVAQSTPGISEIHEFAALNVAFAISSAVGAVVGGQIYDHITQGWAATIWFCFACLVVAIPAPLLYTGARPLLWRILRRNGRFKKDLVMVGRIDEENRLEGDGAPIASDMRGREIDEMEMGETKGKRRQAEAGKEDERGQGGARLV